MTVNPYHFVPVSDAFAKDHRTPVERLQQDLDEGLGHQRYAPGRRSGRVLCRLRTVSPIVVGGKQERAQGEAATVDPYQVNDQFAIPASTLRGMISAVAEAASNSALRVLEDRPYSYRMPARSNPPGALGEVVADDTIPAGFALRPLTMPPAPAGSGSFEVPSEFRAKHRIAPLKVYLQQATVQRDGLQTWSDDHKIEHGLELDTIPESDRAAWKSGRGVRVHSWMRLKNNLFLLAQHPRNETLRLWEDIHQDDRHRYARGIVRTMSAPRRDLPNNRHFEVFLPRDPDNFVMDPIALDQAVIDRFHRLADERTEATRERDEVTLPYHPVGTTRANEEDLEKELFRLKVGDLVYYRATNGTVDEITLSSIWRRSVEDRHAKPYTAGDFFRAVDPDLVPFSSHRAEGSLTMAERLFGFVAEDDTGGTLPALAGRLRFATGLIEGDGDSSACLLDSCSLRILASPKPPCPPLYFSDAANPSRAIDKGSLVPHKASTGGVGTPGVPHGRKFYLHQSWNPQHRTQVAEWPWRDPSNDPAATARMQSRVTPLRDGLSFEFAVDFDNLDEDELGLLLYSLRPTEKFMHKIGMGKSLGLGSVQIDVIGLFEIDRAVRYTKAGWGEPRYANVYRHAGPLPADARYRVERAVLEAQPSDRTAIDRLVKNWRDPMDETIRGVLERIGEAVFPPGKVSVPLVHGGSRNKNTYEWFVANESAKQALHPLTAPAGNQSPEAGWPELADLPRPQARR